VLNPDGVDFSRAGREWFEDQAQCCLASPPKRRPLARLCLDWTERRNHLGGYLGAKLAAMMLERGYVVRGTKRRILTVTSTGKRFFRDELEIDVDACAEPRTRYTCAVAQSA
jgi:hypothetical protein